jgi:hypothetical protein
MGITLTGERRPPVRLCVASWHWVGMNETVMARRTFHTLFDTLTVRLHEALGDSLRRLRHKSEFD